jgi:PAS domain S-box-containing protein
MRRISTIAAQSLLAVLLTVISVLGLSSLIELNVLKQRETRLLQDRGALAARRIANSLSYTLWNLNLEETKRVVLDEISSVDVSRIQVFDEKGALYLGAVKRADGSIQVINGAAATTVIAAQARYTFSENIIHGNKIGGVTVDITDAHLQSELEKLRMGIAVKLLLLVLLLSLVLLIALRVLVVSPLSALERWVERIPSERAPTPLRFKRSEEIDSRAAAFTSMSLTLKEKNEELQNEQARLREVNQQMLVETEERQRAEEAVRISEQKFSKAFRSSPVALAVNRLRDATFLEVNQALEKFTGYERDELIGKSTVELGLWVKLEHREVLLEEMLKSGSLRDREVQFRGKQGNLIVSYYSGELIEIEGEQCVLSVLVDITYRKRAEEALRALSARIHSAREEEGTRIAREIHDELGGALTGLKWDLETIDNSLGKSGNGAGLSDVRKRIGTMTTLIESTINTVRRISSDLRPGVLDDLGLVAAIEWQVQQFQSRSGLECHWTSNLHDVQLSRERATVVFRIFQEILTNVLRHSSASNLYISIRAVEGALELKVKDDGRGITESERNNPRSLGLLGMKERALLVGGDVEISGAEGEGTTVVVRVPIGSDLV